MAGRVMLAVVLMVAVLASTALRAASANVVQEKKSPPVAYEPVPESEMVEIDGRKNPEQIPQWDAWLAAFELISRKSDLPTEVHRQVSREEAATIIDAAKENSKNLLALQQRVLQLMPTVQPDNIKQVTEKTKTWNVEFRSQLLAIRDRVLATLNPSGQTALNGYVESLKAGMRVFVPKKDLAYYRTPQ